MSDPKRNNQETYDEIMKILNALPEENRKVVLLAMLANRCRTCLDYDPSGSFWCCYNSRGG